MGVYSYRAYAWFRSRKWERNKERKRQEEEEKKVHREGGNCLGMQRTARWVWVPVTQPEALFSTGDGKRKFFVNQNAVFVLLFRYATECYAFIFFCTYHVLTHLFLVHIDHRWATGGPRASQFTLLFVCFSNVRQNLYLTSSCLVSCVTSVSFFFYKYSVSYRYWSNKPIQTIATKNLCNVAVI